LIIPVVEARSHNRRAASVVNDTTRLLGLEGVAVTKVDAENENAGQGPVVYLETLDVRARAYPVCGTIATRMKEWVLTRPRDLPVAGRPCRLRWCKRRWLRDQGECPRQSFTECVPQIPARARMTVRLRQAAGAAVADGGRTIVQSARDHGLSWPVVSAAFTAYAEHVLPAEPDPVGVLGIDETRRGRLRWVYDERAQAWTTAVDRWHVGFVDLSDGQGLLGRVEGRTSQMVIDWLDARGPSWKNQVRHVAIDMCTIFKAAVRAALPHATLVVDHFHVVQLVSAAVVLTDGRTIHTKVTASGDPDTDERRSAGWTATRASDPRFALTQLARIDRGDIPGPLTGRLDTTRVAATGHSIGGAAALQTARQDDRFTAVIDIDGYPRGLVRRPYPQPVLALTQDIGPDTDPDYIPRLIRTLGNGASAGYRLTVPGTDTSPSPTPPCTCRPCPSSPAPWTAPKAPASPPTPPSPSSAPRSAATRPIPQSRCPATATSPSTARTLPDRRRRPAPG
jgi:transposase